MSEETRREKENYVAGTSSEVGGIPADEIVRWQEAAKKRGETEAERVSDPKWIKELEGVARDLGLEMNYVPALDELTLRNEDGRSIFALGFSREEEEVYPGDPVVSFSVMRLSEEWRGKYEWDQKYADLWPDELSATVEDLKQMGLEAVPMLEIPSLREKYIRSNRVAEESGERTYRQGIAILPKKGLIVGDKALVFWFDQQLVDQGPARLLPVRWQIIPTDWIKDDSKRIKPAKSGGFGYLRSK